MIKTKYNELQKKYNLPKFEDLNNEFEIEAIDLTRSGILIKAILRVINTKIISFINFLDPITNPNPHSMHSRVELSGLEEEDKQEIFKFYKELSYILHLGLTTELKSEKEIAEYINNFWKKYSKLKKQEIKLLELISKTWIKESIKEKNNYIH